MMNVLVWNIRGLNDHIKQKDCLFMPVMMIWIEGLWENMEQVKTMSGNNLWLLVGDFNVVKSSIEKSGR
jgi:hypothetical protein